MNYQEWEKAVPQTIKGDALWRVEAYRLALFAADLGWHDVTSLFKDRRTLGLADQLYRALGSIGANVAEGYFSRFTKAGSEAQRLPTQEVTRWQISLSL